MHDVIGTQVTVSAVAVYLLEKAKKAKWFPLVQAGSPAVNRVVAVLVALATAAGIHFSFDAGTLTVSGLTGENFIHLAGEAIRAFVFQEGIYQTVILKPQQVVDQVKTPGPPAGGGA